MKKLMKFSCLICMMVFISVHASNKKSDPVSPANTALNPFSHSGKDRNMIVVISDIHLGADLAYAECNKNLGAFSKLLKQIRVAPNVKELVIAGDLLDEWFVPAPINTYQGKDQRDFIQRIANTNKSVINPGYLCAREP
jgi:DNA polymerase II small subunit/DNA polymerase delta subunit B